MNAPQRHHWLYYWAPAVLWLGMIACFSTREFSSGNTGIWLKWVLKLAHLILSRPTFDFLHAAVRKSAHFTVYGILSLLFFRAWRGAPRGHRWKWSWALLALAVCLPAASLDEYHQSFTPGRTAAVSDVELDMMGAVFAQFMIVAWTAGNRLRGSSGATGERRG